MRLTASPRSSTAAMRMPAVAGTFYPADGRALERLVDGLLARAGLADADTTIAAPRLVGILVPHAGLAYSGVVAAVAWQRLARALAVPGGVDTRQAPTLVLLGTVHRAGWLDGVGVWDAGPWRTPLADIGIDTALASDIAALGPSFAIDRAAHAQEHSLEVQLPFVGRLLPDARIVPLAVAAGTGAAAAAAGRQLGTLLADRRAAGLPTVLVISTDMAHYPPADVAVSVTDALLPDILALDPVRLAADEADVSGSGLPGVVCGMCGIAPTVLGLAALRAMGVERGARLAAATSADEGGPRDRTVGYLAAAFPP